MDDGGEGGVGRDLERVGGRPAPTALQVKVGESGSLIAPLAGVSNVGVPGAAVKRSSVAVWCTVIGSADWPCTSIV